MRVSRRSFLRAGAAAGTGLVVGFRLRDASAAAGLPPAAFQPNAYIEIAGDGMVTLWVTRSEMGQGVRTTLPAILAEELDVDLARVRLEQAMPGERFKGIRLRTSGSGSSSGSYRALRVAGASAREMLVAAAAATWGVDPKSCRAELGQVIHGASGRRLAYGRLAARAARLTPPSDPPLKDAKRLRLIGARVKRTDGPAIVSGGARYGIDVRVPGMLVAVMERCPYLGGKVSGFDAKRALAVPGVRHVVPIASGISAGVAVAADTTWAALKGREALSVTWDPGPNRDFDSGRFIQSLEDAFSQEGYPIRRVGDADAAAGAASARVIEAVYEYPFQAHAPIEPMNCTADVRKDSCEVWVPTQTPETAYDDIVKTHGFAPGAVKVHTTLLGGGFGRRLFVDYVHEAVELSKAIGRPVQLLWTRTDDMRHGFFHPATIDRLRAVLSDDGRPLAWLHTSVGSDLSMFGPPSEEQKKDRQRYAKDGSPWGAFDNPYAFPSMKVDYVPVDSPVPTGPWRAVEYPSSVFARESFIDEIAHSLGKDPLQLRIDLLQPGDVLNLGDEAIERGRLIRVLETAREATGWATPPAHTQDRLRGRGVAVNTYFGESYIAQVAEVSVARDLGDLRVHRIACIVDCGTVINPLGLEGQAESGITWGLSAALHGKIDFRNGGALQENYADFAVMRMDEMPVIDTRIVPSDAFPSGFGEHAVPPVAPAVANAVFAATGKRLRRLPLIPAGLRA